MKLLYIACNPPTEGPLMVESEINELTLRMYAIPGEQIRCVFMPSCRFEDLPHQIAHHRPDILHIAAHADNEKLFLANARGDKVLVTGEMLSRILPTDHPPQMVYLNTCNSQEMANVLVRRVPIVIASTTAISNLAARTCAGTFYARIAEGGTVRDAFEAARAVSEGMQATGDWELFAQTDTDVDELRPCPRFEIVARFSRSKPSRDSKGFYDLHFGVIGAPANTTQVVLFTDESSFILEADDSCESDMAQELAMVGRHSITRGWMWFHEGWPTDGDFRLYACAVTASGTITTATSMVGDAIERYYKKSSSQDGKVPKESALREIASLRKS